MSGPAGLARWLYRPLPPRSATLLLCFPAAGAGASAFRSWPVEAGGVVPCPVQLPGREGRFREPPAISLLTLAAELAAVVVELQRPLALFGHSLGALVAYALAVQLQASGCEPPRRLFVAASPPPGAEWWRSLSVLPDSALRERLRQRIGLPEGQVEAGELIDLLLRVLRADLALAAGYVPPGSGPLRCPITVLAGDGDAEVAPSEMEGWARHTAAGCSFRVVPGGHDLLAGNERTILLAVAQDLTEA